MKAIYQNPTTDYITLSLEQLIAASKGILSDDPTKDDFDLGDVNPTDAVSGNLSRRSVWDDGLEDEEF